MYEVKRKNNGRDCSAQILDDFKRQCLVNWIKSGENLRMKQIQEWCHWHQIPVKTKFFYRKDFPVKANLWNLYSYSRFKIDLIRK